MEIEKRNEHYKSTSVTMAPYADGNANVMGNLLQVHTLTRKTQCNR